MGPRDSKGAYIGVKCSRKQDRNLDSASPPSPVTGDAENWCADERAPFDVSFSLVFLFLSGARCCAWTLAEAAKPRGRPSFLFVEYVH